MCIFRKRKKKQETIEETPIYRDYDVQEIENENGVFSKIKLIFPYGYITITDINFKDFYEVENCIVETIKFFIEIREKLNICYGIKNIVYNYKTKDYKITIVE